MNQRNKSQHLGKQPNNSYGKVSIGELMIFLLWPFGILFHSLRYFKASNAKLLFWLFCLFYGFLFIYDEPDLLGRGGTDSSVYAAKLIQQHEESVPIQVFVSKLYSSKDGYSDVYQPFVTWFVSFFTKDPRWLFMVFAGVFGFFYAKNLWFFLSRISGKPSLILILYLIAFALLNPIWNINGVRMWTAMHVFLFGILQYVIYDKKILGFIWCLLSVLIHFSFLFPIVLLMAYVLIPKKIHPLFYFYLFTLFINEINLESIRNIVSFLPDVFVGRASGYTNTEYSEGVSQAKLGMSWHIVLYEIVSKWITYFWIILLYLKKKVWFRPGTIHANMYLLGLFIGGFANIFSLVPSGARFLVLSNSIFYSVIILLLIKRDVPHKLYNMGKVTIYPIAFIILFQIRLGLDFIGVYTILANPLVAYWVEEQKPIIEAIKSLI